MKCDDNGQSNKVIVKFSKRKNKVRVMTNEKSLKMLASMVQVSTKTLHYLLFLVFTITTSICGLNVKPYGQVNQYPHSEYRTAQYE